MTNRSNLTPTVITDVNGKITTVHRKNTMPLASKLPVPLPVKRQIYSLDVEDLITDILAALSGFDLSFDAQYSRGTMLQYEYDLLADMMEVCHDPETANLIAELVDVEASSRLVTECLHYFPRLECRDPSTVPRLMRGVRQYDDMISNSEDLSLSPQDIQDSYVALMNVAYALEETNHPDAITYEHGGRHGAPRITDTDLSSHLMAHPEDAETYLYVIRQHGTIRRAEILAVLEGDSPVLVEGVL